MFSISTLQPHDDNNQHRHHGIIKWIEFNWKATMRLIRWSHHCRQCQSQQPLTAFANWNFYFNLNLNIISWVLFKRNVLALTYLCQMFFPKKIPRELYVSTMASWPRIAHAGRKTKSSFPTVFPDIFSIGSHKFGIIQKPVSQNCESK